MMRIILALALAAVASAFQAPVALRSPTRSMRMGVSDMIGASHETGGKVFDPWGLSTLGSDETLAWFRQAEVKHGRVAMAACTGWILQGLGLHFPGYISPSAGITFESLGTKGLAAWDAVPDAGKLQIILFVGLLEADGEALAAARGGHPMMGGASVASTWDPLGFTKRLSPEAKEKKLLSELKNGRLAMIGIMSFVAAAKTQGSVPVLPYPF